MRFQLSRRVAFVLTALLLVGFCLTESNAQQKRRTKKPRRVTNPVTTAAPAPTPTSATPANEAQIISTADETASESGATTNGRRTGTRRTTAPQSEEDNVRQQVDRLSTQFNRMNEKLSQMEQQQRTLVDLERLTRAETRAENLREQLRNVLTKEADLQSRSDQIDYELQPSVIERTMATTGSTRPEDLRDLRRRQLESEKSRVQSQLNQMATSRARLETAIANADAEADRIRARVEAATPPPETTSTDVGEPSTTTSPTDTGEGEPE
jgi:chromosome segregation ATPase